MQTQLEKIEKNLHDALVSVRALIEANAVSTQKNAGQSPVRNREWFKSNNIHLSDAGKKKINELFEAGYTPKQASIAMGIDYGSACKRRATWLKEKMGKPLTN